MRIGPRKKSQKKKPVFHELFEKQHRVTPKRNESNKKNSWRLASRIAGENIFGLWHKNKAPGAKNVGYEAGNLQIYSFSWKRPNEFSRNCFCCVLPKNQYFVILRIFLPENYENYIFSVWPTCESGMHEKWIFFEFLEFFEVFEGFSGFSLYGSTLGAPEVMQPLEPQDTTIWCKNPEKPSNTSKKS